MEYTLDVRCMKGLNSTWDYKTNVPSDRQNFAVATFSGRLLVIGGWLHGPSAVVEAYDGSTWERMPDLLTPRSAAAAGCLLRFCPVLLLALIPVCLILTAFVLESSASLILLRLHHHLLLSCNSANGKSAVRVWRH